MGVKLDLRRFYGVPGVFVWFGDINGVAGVVWACAPGGGCAPVRRAVGMFPAVGVECAPGFPGAAGGGLVGEQKSPAGRNTGRGWRALCG